MNWLILWLAAAIILSVFEFFTVQLVAIWFAAGSIGALVACSLNAPVPVQILVFMIISIILLILTRPAAKKLFEKNGGEKSRTNADRLLGQTAIVVEKIDNCAMSGAVKISGVVWTARSSDGSMIRKGSEVKILKIESTKLIVTGNVTKHADMAKPQ